MTDKAAWRTWAKERRQELLPQLPEISGQILKHLVAFLHARGAVTVLAYHALPGEVELAPLQTYFSLLTTRAHFGPPRRLSLHTWESATERSKLGILQPPKGTPEVSLFTVDAVLLPALAFDAAGVRLGYGGGFYDRLLEGWQGLKIGVVPQALLLERLPAETYDIRANVVVTENGIYSCAE